MVGPNNGQRNNYHLTDDCIERIKFNDVDNERWAAIDRVKNEEKDAWPQGELDFFLSLLSIAAHQIFDEISPRSNRRKNCCSYVFRAATDHGRRTQRAIIDIRRQCHLLVVVCALKFVWIYWWTGMRPIASQFTYLVIFTAKYNRRVDFMILWMRWLASYIRSICGQTISTRFWFQLTIYKLWMLCVVYAACSLRTKHQNKDEEEEKKN